MSQAEFNNSDPETKTSELSTGGGDRSIEAIQALDQSIEVEAVAEVAAEADQVNQQVNQVNEKDPASAVIAAGTGAESRSPSLIEAQEYQESSESQESNSATNLTGAIGDLDLITDLVDLAVNESLDQLDQADQTDTFAHQTTSIDQLLTGNESVQMAANHNDSINNNSINLATDQADQSDQFAANQEFDQVDQSEADQPKLELDPELEPIEPKLDPKQLQALLYQTQEKLSLTEQLVERQENLTHSLQMRIDELEQVLQQKEIEITQVSCDRQELRNRLKRQKHHNSQLKAALERCLDSPVSLAESADSIDSADGNEGGLVESWNVTQLDQAFINKPEPTIASSQPVGFEQMNSAINANSANSLNADESQDLDLDNMTIEPALESLSAAIAATIAKVTNYADPALLGKAELGTNPEFDQEGAIGDLVNQVEQLAQFAQPIAAETFNASNAPSDLNNANHPGNAQIEELVAFTQSPAYDAYALEPGIAEPEAAKLDPEAKPAAIANYSHQADHTPTYNHSSYNYAGIVAVPRVAAPKFIQDLTTGKIGNSEPAPTISSKINGGERKPIPSLAAVKLPQFPPLSR
jgi:hypothetical protein